LKVMILYYSETGNTEKVARAVAEALEPKAEVSLRRVEEASEDLGEYELIFLGTPVHALGPAKPVREFLERLSANLEGLCFALFCTYSMAGAGRTLDFMEKKLANKGAKVLGKFAVFGAFKTFFKHFKKGRPDEKDLAYAKEKAEEIFSALQR